MIPGAVPWGLVLGASVGMGLASSLWVSLVGWSGWFWLNMFVWFYKPFKGAHCSIMYENNILVACLSLEGLLIRFHVLPVIFLNTVIIIIAIITLILIYFSFLLSIMDGGGGLMPFVLIALHLF